MKNNDKFMILSHILLLVLLAAGCTFNFSCVDQSEKFTKIMHMPLMPLSPGSSFETVTHNGSIDVLGSDVTDCNVIATVIGRASTVEAAEEVVERTKLSFEQLGEGLVLKIDRPNLFNRSVSVSLNIVLPDKVNLDLQSHNGGIEIENITGKTTATSHNGRVFVKNILGIMKLETHNGAIDAENISGDIDFLTHNGRVKAVFSENAEPDSDIRMVTHNGSIDLTPPQNYSARFDISTHNGNIDTRLPVTIEGRYSGKKLTGIIGDGSGMLKLETYNGSINIR